jgi:hypothetical protein
MAAEITGYMPFAAMNALQGGALNQITINGKLKA